MRIFAKLIKGFSLMERNWVPQGVAFYKFDQPVETESYVFVLLPNLSLNAFSAAIEPLRIANQLTGKELFHWRCVSQDGKPVCCSNGVPIGVDGTLDDICPKDTVLVCSGVMPERSYSKKVASRLRYLWRRGHTVGGICTGAYTLAGAGLLKGIKFTLHWENLPAFAELYPDLEPSEQVFVCDRRIWTCAGGLASTDLMVSRIHESFGKDLAGTVANMFLYQSPRTAFEPQKPSTASAIGVRHPKLVKVLNTLERKLDQECNLDELAEEVCLSRRQLERLFNRYLSTTPKQYLTSLRLFRARALMSETNLGVNEISAACGFGSPSHFSKRFKQVFGVSPHRFSITHSSRPIR